MGLNGREVPEADVAQAVSRVVERGGHGLLCLRTRDDGAPIQQDSRQESCERDGRPHDYLDAL
jgi:hypothetical protein